MGGGHGRLDTFYLLSWCFAFFSGSLLVGGLLFIAWLGGLLYSTVVSGSDCSCAFVAICNICINVLNLPSAYNPLILFIGLSDREIKLKDIGRYT